MSIKGQLQDLQVNDWGYARVKVSGTYYGADKKGQLNVVVGDFVELDAYEKTGTNGKQYPTFKYQSIKRTGGPDSAVQTANQAPGPGVSGNNQASRAPNSGGASSGRESYWSDKAAEDAKRDPRISYQGAYDRALTFADLALRNGAFLAFGKAKDTAKLGILEAFVSEYADKIMQQTYAATVPAARTLTPAVDETADTIGDGESEAQWS